jgi:hypothetical protein
MERQSEAEAAATDSRTASSAKIFLVDRGAVLGDPFVQAVNAFTV